MQALQACVFRIGVRAGQVHKAYGHVRAGLIHALVQLCLGRFPQFRLHILDGFDRAVIFFCAHLCAADLEQLDAREWIGAQAGAVQVPLRQVHGGAFAVLAHGQDTGVYAAVVHRQPRPQQVLGVADGYPAPGTRRLGNVQVIVVPYHHGPGLPHHAHILIQQAADQVALAPVRGGNGVGHVAKAAYFDGLVLPGRHQPLGHGLRGGLRLRLVGGYHVVEQVVADVPGLHLHLRTVLILLHGIDAEQLILHRLGRYDLCPGIACLGNVPHKGEVGVRRNISGYAPRGHSRIPSAANGLAGDDDLLSGMQPVQPCGILPRAGENRQPAPRPGVHPVNLLNRALRHMGQLQSRGGDGWHRHAQHAAHLRQTPLQVIRYRNHQLGFVGAPRPLRHAGGQHR